ncbi:hypothetical protein ACNKHO_17390 [Shigella flexneri]
MHSDVGHRCIGEGRRRMSVIPTSYRWATRLKSSPRSSQTQAATG